MRTPLWRSAVTAVVAATAALVIAMPATPAAAHTLSGATHSTGSTAHDTLAPTPRRASTAAAPPAAALPPHGARTVPAGCNVGETGPRAESSTPYARCFADGLADAQGRLVQRDDEPVAGSLGPAEIKDAYDLPAGGAGRTVAIVDAFGYTSAESDLAVFRAHYGLPACTTKNGCFRKVDQRGGTHYPPNDGDWSIETALDLDAVSSACPACHILLVEADDNGSPNLGQAVDTAASLHATAISNSYGIAGEIPFESYYDHFYDHPGIAVTASTGDDGNVQSYPATDPDVIAVGGTTLTRDPTTPRGWTETAWSDGGSGCSLYEPAPDFQGSVDTQCDGTRGTADVAADADSDTGLAVYNTLGQDGWAQWGGTSLASPLVAAMYALAGPAIPGSYPAGYVYRHGAAINDVTDGTNSGCGTIACTAGPGWDGPTGVGTPAGVSALTMGRAASVTGTVKTSVGPLAGARVTLTDATGYAFHGLSDAKGHYKVAVAAGSYTMTVTEFGYSGATISSVSVAAGKTATRAATLRKLPSRTLTGTVRDASGQGWPIYAKVAIAVAGPGQPPTSGAVYTDPVTGTYSARVPSGTSYTLTATPVEMPGYQSATATVAVGSGFTPVSQDLALSVDPSTCIAPGYAYQYAGAGTDFDGWTAPQDGWTVTDDAGTGKTWGFDDVGKRGNMTGGSGGFAIVDDWINPTTDDTSLVSPPLDFSQQTDPEIGFDSYYYDYGFGAEDGYVDLSLDGGATWQNVWTAPDAFVQGPVEVPIPQAAGAADARVRFRFVGEDYWELDDVFAGTRSCGPLTGGLVTGRVTDANTGGGLVGAEVTTGAGVPAVTVATPDDPREGDGFYWAFVPGDGTQTVTATGNHYANETARITPVAHDAVRHLWSLRAGRVSRASGTISVRTSTAQAQTTTLTLRNTGSAPATVQIVEQDRGFTPVGGSHRAYAPGARLTRVPLRSPLSFRPGATPRVAPRDAAVNPAWSSLPDFLTPIMDNTVAENDGIVYSVGGASDIGTTSAGAAYDPATHAWRALAPMPAARQNAVGGFLDGRLYVAGGWDAKGNPTRTTFVYDPATKSWSHAADMPQASAVSAGAVVGNRLYVVAGCSTAVCPTASSVYRYDPATDAWTKLSDYPVSVVMAGCAPSGDGLLCAGGLDPATESATSGTYAYSASSESWSKVGDLPFDLWGMSASGSGGKLEFVGGITASAITNQAEEFDPVTAHWTALPNATYAGYRGGAACGLTRVGGSIGDFVAVPYTETLSGQDSCVAGSDVGWLSTDTTQVTIPVGRSVTIHVRTDPAQTTTKGEYDARLAFVSDTPYTIAPVTVSLTRR